MSTIIPSAELGSFDFHGDTVSVVTDDAGHWAVLGQLAQNLTLDPESQRKAILRKSWSQGRTAVMEVQVPGDGQRRPQFLIHERIVPMWLANITTSRIKDMVKREKVETAQVELADALHAYMTGRVQVHAPAALPRTMPEALRALAAEMERGEVLSAEVAELDATNRKLSPKAARADQYEANPGITPTVFHKTWFPKLGEREFFEHLYRKDYLIDQRNTLWDPVKQEWKDGLEHRHPAAKGKRYFYLQPAIDRKGWRRERTLVIPGDAEHDLVAALERDGLPSINRPAIPGAEVLHMPRQMRGGDAS